jgi:flagellar protein FlgJ
MMPIPPPAVRSTPSADAPATPQDFLSPRVAASASSSGAAASTSAASAQQVTPFAPTDVDSSSPEAFIRSIAPYAARVSKATGIPAAAMIGMAANETGYGKYASHNNLFGIKGTGPAGSFNTPTWEDYGGGRVNITDNFRAYHSPAESFIDFADLIETSPRYKGAVGQTTVAGFVSGLRQGGYMTDPDYVSKINAITTRYSSVIDDSLRQAGAAPLSGSSTQPVPTAAVGAQLSRSTAQPAQTAASASSPVSLPIAGVIVPDQLHIGLPADEALAACGPVAAIAFAQVYGRNPTPAEAIELAKQSGWTVAGGMNGIANEKRLLDKLGLPSQLEMGANWDHIRGEAMQHQPVILSTPGHYFVIDGYDPNNGAYHVGQSGKVYRGGSDWLTPAQIQGLAGAPSGALYAVHPLAGGANAAALPPMQMPAGPRQVLPPLPIASGQREVLPPLDLGNTPRPPPIAPKSAPAPIEVPAILAPVAVHDVPPPGLIHADASPQPTPVSVPGPAPVVPAPVSVPGPAPAVVTASDTPAGPADAASLVPSDDPQTIVQPTPPPADTARFAGPGLNPGMAIGVVAVGGQRQPPAPPPPPGRGREDEDPLPNA